MRLNINYKITLIFILTAVIILASALLYLDTIPKNIIAFSLLFVFILSGLISLTVSVFVSRPIRKMTRLARSMADGDLSKRVSIAALDEIGDLAAAFNYMIEQIKLKIDEVTANRSRLEAVFLSMVEGVMVLDARGAILLMNQALKNFLQVEKNPRGRKPLEIIRNIEIQEIAEAALKLKEEVATREISVRLPDEKILLVHAAPVIHGDNPDGAVLIFHDITDLRRLEKVRRDFVANVSHELRTPVASVKGYAETLFEGALEDKKNARGFLKIIHDDAGRLSKLVDELLDLSRIESGRLELNLKPGRLKALMTRVVSGLNKQAQQKSIIIKIDMPENLPEIKIDENRIAQVLLNFIDNAIKYTPAGGQIVISASAGKKDEFVRVDVKDTGIGIPEKDLPRIFERFYRVDKARSRELGGTGLGLSIVKHIIEAHGGEAFAQSRPGQGSTFSFTLPPSSPALPGQPSRGFISSLSAHPSSLIRIFGPLVFLGGYFVHL